MALGSVMTFTKRYRVTFDTKTRKIRNDTKREKEIRLKIASRTRLNDVEQI